MRILTWLSFFLFSLPLSLLTLLLSNVVVHGLAKPALSQEAAVLLAFAILVGGLVDLPIKSISREKIVLLIPSRFLAFPGFCLDGSASTKRPALTFFARKILNALTRDWRTRRFDAIMLSTVPSAYLG